MNQTIDRAFLIHTLQDLVRINSINPGLIPGAPGEGAIAQYIHRKLEALGVEASLKMIRPGRPNVVALLPGKGNGRSLMLNAHTDTVGVEGMDEPFRAWKKMADLRKGRPGHEASIAAMLAVAKAVVDHRLVIKGDLILAFVMDEEHESLGTEAVLKDYRPNGAIVTEPTELGICTAHKGLAFLK